MSRVGAFSTLVLAAGLMVACSHPVSGSPRPANTAVAVLLTEEEMTRAVGVGLSSFGFRPFVGGPEIMPDGFRTDAEATPIRCAGVTETMLRITYADADVVEAARQSYFDLTRNVAVSGVDAAVVRFVSPAEAKQRFDAFAAAWLDCDGLRVIKHLGAAGSDVTAAIADVIEHGPTLSATVTTDQRGGASGRYLRAVELRGAAIVEVAAAVTAAADGGAALSATRAMADKVPR